VTTPNKGYISQLPQATTIGPYDYAVIDQLTSGSPTTRRAALSQLFSLRQVRVTANYTLQPADLLLPTVIYLSSSSPLTLTIPTAAVLLAANSGASVPNGVNVMFQRYGTGTLTIAGSAGVTLRYASSVTLKNQFSMGFALLSDIANEWGLGGDFT
jgi:hypothetical protein